MENQIVCPNCKKTISHNATIDAAAKGQSSSLRAIMCDCGERITFWQITAQLRDQKKLGYKIKAWVRSFSTNRG